MLRKSCKGKGILLIVIGITCTGLTIIFDYFSDHVLNLNMLPIIMVCFFSIAIGAMLIISGSHNQEKPDDYGDFDASRSRLLRRIRYMSKDAKWAAFVIILVITLGGIIWLYKENTSQGADGEIIVYITRTGIKYHCEGCPYLSQSKIPITLEEAKRQGYAPCSLCNPPRAMSRASGSDIILPCAVIETTCRKQNIGRVHTMLEPNVI